MELQHGNNIHCCCNHFISVLHRRLMSFSPIKKNKNDEEGLKLILRAYSRGVVSILFPSHFLKRCCILFFSLLLSSIFRNHIEFHKRRVKTRTTQSSSYKYLKFAFINHGRNIFQTIMIFLLALSSCTK